MTESTIFPVAEPVTEPVAELPRASPGRAPLFVRLANLFVIVVPLLGLIAARFFLSG